MVSPSAPDNKRDPLRASATGAGDPTCACGMCHGQGLLKAGGAHSGRCTASLSSQAAKENHFGRGDGTHESRIWDWDAGKELKRYDARHDHELNGPGRVGSEPASLLASFTWLAEGQNHAAVGTWTTWRLSCSPASRGTGQGAGPWRFSPRQPGRLQRLNPRAGTITTCAYWE